VSHKSPADQWNYQEILHDLKPTVICVCVDAHGRADPCSHNCIPGATAINAVVSSHIPALTEPAYSKIRCY